MDEVGNEALLTESTRVCKPHIQLLQCEITEHRIGHSIDELVLCVFPRRKSSTQCNRGVPLDITSSTALPREEGEQSCSGLGYNKYHIIHRLG
jgi:hypothetical protein